MVFIEKEAKDPDRCSEPRLFSASARAAFTHILAAHKGKDPRGILLPAYIGVSKVEGSGVFDPIRTTDFPYAFYRVNEHLVPDLVDIQNQLAGGRFQFVFLIHYFGCPQVDVQSFVNLCHEHGAQVIEDCAHTLLGGLGPRRLGHFGDYAIFSVHKCTATRDGGFYYDTHKQLADVDLAEKFRISHTTLEQFARLDVRSLVETRAANYAVLAGWVERLPGLKLFLPRDPGTDVPLNCPVVVANGKREALYFSLVEKGLQPTALYHTLIPQIPRAVYPEAHALSESILNLPTHPDILPDEFPRYQETLHECMEKVCRA